MPLMEYTCSPVNDSFKLYMSQFDFQISYWLNHIRRSTILVIVFQYFSSCWNILSLFHPAAHVNLAFMLASSGSIQILRNCSLSYALSIQ